VRHEQCPSEQVQEGSRCMKLSVAITTRAVETPLPDALVSVTHTERFRKAMQLGYNRLN